MRPLCCQPSSARWWRRAAQRNRPNGASLSILSRSATKRPRKCRSCSRQTAARVAGRTTRRSPWSCWATIRPGSSTRSTEQSVRAPFRQTSADHSLTGRLFAWPASATPTSTPTGRRRITSSPTPTRSTGCSAADSDVSAVRGVLHGAMALYLTRYLNVPPARIPGEGDEQPNDLPANEEAIRIALLDAFDRQRQVDLAARLV